MGQYIRQRAPNVEFRVGDVVFHENQQFRGVIIGWDEKAKAPEKYLKAAHGEKTVRRTGRLLYIPQSPQTPRLLELP